MGGEVTSCEVNLFFGLYPSPTTMQSTIPPSTWDTGSVKPYYSAVTPPASQAEKDTANRRRVQEAAGQSGGKSESAVVNGISAFLIVLAFGAFLNEMYDMVSMLIKCLLHEAEDGLTVSDISSCMTQTVATWWWRAQGNISAIITVVSHWIDIADWSLQVILFFYVVGPTIMLMWKSSGSHQGAALGFVVDRHLGAATEDEHFEDHWFELNQFLEELFSRACGDPPSTVREFNAKRTEEETRVMWEEIAGDREANPVPESAAAPPAAVPMDSSGSRPSAAAPSEATPVASPEPAPEPTPSQDDPTTARRKSVRKSLKQARALRASWSQVEEMTALLLSPVTAQVRIFRKVLALLDTESVMAVYPEVMRPDFPEFVMFFVTCGLEWILHWRKQRREGAIILTDRRLVQVSTNSGPFHRSLKVDSFVIGSSVKYLMLDPRHRRCCAIPDGRMLFATRCGSLQLHLKRIGRNRNCATTLWRSLTMLQDAPPITKLNLGSWATVASSCASEEEAQEEPEQERKEEELTPRVLDAMALWRATTAADIVSGAPPGTGTRRHTLSFDCFEPCELTLTEDEQILWGPTLFEEELRARFLPQLRQNLIMPTALVTLTSRRIIVVQFKIYRLFAGAMSKIFPPRVHSVVFVPLRWVLGFSVEETFTYQKSFLLKVLNTCCGCFGSESLLKIRCLTNAGLGKVYLDSLCINQIVLPRGANAEVCNFEDKRVLELRRWLGNIALFNGEAMSALELMSCPRGWAPA